MSKITESSSVHAQAELYHAWLLGLMLMVVTQHGNTLTGEWMFRLFRRQHLAKFKSSFEKLGLAGLPDAVACARYHVLSNQIGGVAVEFMPENERKAWVRFRYPRWMYAGPTICAMPIEVSRGFLRGWYAHNGVSLGNPRLGFVCVSEDMSDDYGLCGYFREYDHDLTPEQRLQFSDEPPPQFDTSKQPTLPPSQWTPARLANAQRSYALEYIRNGVAELIELVGLEIAKTLASRSAQLIGMQYYAQTAQHLGACDGSAQDARQYLLRMFEQMVDRVETPAENDATAVSLRLSGLRITHGFSEPAACVLADAWLQLAHGALKAHRAIFGLQVQRGADGSYYCEITSFNKRAP